MDASNTGQNHIPFDKVLEDIKGSSIKVALNKID